MKKNNKGCLIGIIIAAAVMFFIAAVIVIGVVIFGGDESDVKNVNLNIPNLREHYTQLTGNDTATVMVYVIGSDLESDGGCASEDISEMLSAELGENVNVIIQTGGASEWTNPMISSDTCQRFSIDGNNLTPVADIGLVNMAEPSTLTDFISWAAGYKPANRYELIFWDHGGGTAVGYGVDENFPDSCLELSDIAQAIGASGVKFDFVGFDACLMGTVETAYMLEPYADYLIASEETEPGSGWYYTNWLTKLSENSSMDTVELAKIIIDDFVEGPDVSFFDTNTLSVIELREIPYLYEKLCGFMRNSTNVLTSDFDKISNARANAKDFGDGGFEQIDILDYVKKSGIDGAEDLQNAVLSAVKYSNSNTVNANGLAMYFPYDVPEYYEQMLAELEKIGYGGDCTGFFSQFINIMVGGQTNMQSSPNSAPSETDYSSYSWYDEESTSDIDYSESNYGEKELIDKGDYYALHMSESEWDKITYAELWLYIDDGEGYIDFGTDNMYEFDDDGDLKVDFDYTWVALNSQPVPFFAEYENKTDDGSWCTYGYVPALLNGEDMIDIMVYWDNNHTDGYVAGYRYSDDDMTPAGKGWKQFKNGDKIEYVCDYYTYDGEYDDWYIWSEPLVYNGNIAVSYENIGDVDTNICFMLKDVYNNSFFTESVELSIG